MSICRDKRARRAPAACFTVLCAVAMATSASGEVNVEPLEGTTVTRLTVHAGDGSVTRGTVATGPVGPAVIYHADYTGYIAGCWGHTCAFGFADEMRFHNIPLGGAEVSSYSFSYAAGYAYLFDYCVPGDPSAGDCSCYCPTGGECDEGDPPYTVDAALYDGPPGLCGGGMPIAGTEVQFQTTASRPLGDRLIEVRIDLEPKAFVPREVWGVVTFDTEDAWMSIGEEPIVGYSTGSGAMWLDGDSDGCWDEWDCWGFVYEWVEDGLDWATFHVEANAERAFFLTPVPAPEDSKWFGLSTYTVNGNEAFLSKGGEPVWMEIRLTDWDPFQHGIELKAWQATIDSSGYSSGLQGTLTLYAVEGTCTDASDCADLGTGGRCVMSRECAQASHYATCAECADLGLPCSCAAGFIDNTRTDYVFYGLMELFATRQYPEGYAFASTLMGAPTDSPHRDTYLGTLRLWVPEDAKGTFTLGFLPQQDTALVDSNGQYMPLVGFQPGRITVDFGACCFDLAGDERQCIEGVTQVECDALPEPRLFALGGHCTGDICADCGQCQEDSHCDDGDACTEDICDVAVTCTCAHSLNYDVNTECCDPQTGIVQPLDDGNPCTLLGICDSETGEVVRPPVAPGTSCGEGDACVFGYYCDGAGSCIMDPVPTGSACDDGDECTTDDHCDGAGNCVVNPIAGRPCVNKRACEPGSCVDGVCRCPAEFVAVPAVSKWGTVIAALVLIALGKAYFGRRRGKG